MGMDYYIANGFISGDYGDFLVEKVDGMRVETITDTRIVFDDIYLKKGKYLMFLVAGSWKPFTLLEDTDITLDDIQKELEKYKKEQLREAFLIAEGCKSGQELDMETLFSNLAEVLKRDNKPEEDWPTGAMYRTMDFDGVVKYFRSAPIFNNSTNRWETTDGYEGLKRHTNCNTSLERRL